MNEKLEIIKALIELITTLISLATAIVGLKTIKATKTKKKRKKWFFPSLVIITERMTKMQKIKSIMLVLIAINIIIAINTKYNFITLLAILSILLCSYNLYLIRKRGNNHA